MNDDFNRVINTVKEIMAENELSLSKQAENSDKKAQSCKLGINFEYCDKWDMWIGCSNCPNYIPEKEWKFYE